MNKKSLIPNHDGVGDCRGVFTEADKLETYRLANNILVGKMNKQRRNWNRLKKAYKDYIKLLGEDLSNHASISSIHGCGSKPELVAEGERLRALIAKLEADK